MSHSRRKFLKSAVATGLATKVAAGGLTIFPVTQVFGDDTVVIPHASHWGPFKAVVRDGVLVGVQPLPGIDAKPTEMLTEGILSRLYHETRVRYPMVRKSYLENYGRDTRNELRGREAFVRVSWEEALSLAADAILNTVEKHGNEALFSTSYGGWSHSGLLRPNVLQGRLFGLLGGHSTTVGNYSIAASGASLPHVIGGLGVLGPQTAWPVIAKHTELMVLVGSDPWNNSRIEYRVPDHQMYPAYEKIKKAGVRFISINPQRTATDKAMNAEWVRIVPNTDTALFLAMSHHVVTNNLHDQDYINKYTVGFERFKSYLLGEDADGSPPKTPAWAAQITGIPADKIIELAELIASQRTQLAGGWSLQRADHGEMTHWVMINFAALIGSIGKPGEGVGFSWHYGGGGLPQSGKAMPVGLSQGRNPVKTRCPASRISEMLMNPGKTYPVGGKEHTYPDARLIYNSGNNFISHQQDTNELLGAMNNKIETVICQDPWWCASARFADIVFPATSTLERDDISSGNSNSRDRIYAMRQVIKPVGESLDDFEIFRRLASKLGVEAGFTENGMQVRDILRRSYDASSATMPFDEFWETGLTTLPIPDGADEWVQHGDFFADPVANPLHTASGKIELYCETIAGFKLEECPPMPKWMEPVEYLGNAEEGQLHVLSPHPHMRVHSQMANADVRKHNNVQGRQHVTINTEDAKRHDIEDGDLVEVYNRRGRLIAGARVSSSIMQGVITIEEGNWLQLDSQGRCNSGAVNMLTTSKPSSDLSQATSANTCLASIKKCTDAESKNRAYESPPVEVNSVALNFPADQLRARAMKIRGTVFSEMAPGEKLFYERCTACHIAHDPGEFTIKQWHAITQDTMFPRSGLSTAQQKMVTEFLEKNAKDAK